MLTRCGTCKYFVPYTITDINGLCTKYRWRRYYRTSTGLDRFVI